MNPNFEKHVNQTLRNQEEFVDAEAIWEQVEPHVRPEKKRRKFFWWFFYGASIAIVTMALWHYSQEDSSLLEERNMVAELPASIEEKQSAQVAKEKLLATMKNSESKNNPAAGARQGDNQNTTLETLKQSQQEQANKIKKPTTKLNSLSSEKSSQNDFTQSSSKYKATSPKKGNTGEMTDTQIFEKPIAKSSFIEFLQDGSYRPLSDEPQSSMVVVPLEERAEEDVNVLLSKKLAALTLSSMIGEVSPIKEESQIPGSVKLIVPVHKQPNWKFAIGLHAGIGKVNPTWTPVDESAEFGFYETRKDTEKQLESTSIGLSVSAQMKNKISFRSGLEYHRIARRFNYEESLITYDTIPDEVLTLYVNNTTGDTILDKGEFVNTHTQGYEKETYNYFHRLDIPLFVGYTFKKGRLLLGAEAGIFANVLFQKKGEILNSTEGRSFYDLKEDEAQWYKTKVGLTPAVQMNFGYEFAPGVEAYCSPYYRFKTTYSTDANQVKEAYSDFGVQLGVKYWLR